jgi:hypothetical protein
LAWQKKLSAAKVADVAFEKALATELRNLVCSNDASAIHILHGVIGLLTYYRRLADTGREAPALVDFIMSKDCPVSAALTGDDKARLLEIKQYAEKEFAPQAPQKDK